MSIRIETIKLGIKADKTDLGLVFIGVGDLSGWNVDFHPGNLYNRFPVLSMADKLAWVAGNAIYSRRSLVPMEVPSPQGSWTHWTEQQLVSEPIQGPLACSQLPL